MTRFNMGDRVRLNDGRTGTVEHEQGSGNGFVSYYTILLDEGEVVGSWGGRGLMRINTVSSDPVREAVNRRAIKAKREGRSLG